MLFILLEDDVGSEDKGGEWCYVGDVGDVSAFSSLNDLKLPKEVSLMRRMIYRAYPSTELPKGTEGLPTLAARYHVELVRSHLYTYGIAFPRAVMVQGPRRFRPQCVGYRGRQHAGKAAEVGFR